MLVEINLLSEKRKKDITYWFIILLITLLLLISLFALKLVSDNVQNDIDQLEAERTTVTEEIAMLQQQLEQKPISYYDLLSAAVEKTEQSVIPASELLAELVRLLPEHSYMQNFDFFHPDNVTFDIRFDQINSVAAYSYALDESPFINDVTLATINTEFIEVLEGEDVLPRYVAHFRLTVNRSAFADVKEDD